MRTSPTLNLNIVKGNKNEILTIGWIGGFGGGHKESLLKYFFPALSDLPFAVKLILIGVAKKSEYQFLLRYFSEFKNVLMELPQHIDWHNEAQIQQSISIFDIGIATLLNNELHRSKSAFKAKQYLNNGVPVLSSDIPENNVFVQDGINGFLCTSVSDFRKRIIEINEMNDGQYSNLTRAARQSSFEFDTVKYCENIILQFEKAYS